MSLLQATEDVQEGLTDDDYDMYYEIWQQFDPEGTQYLSYCQLSDFLDVLEAPLQIHKPNKYKIISMDIPICAGDLCYCVDVLDALTKDFFARKGNPVEETAELGEVTAHTDRPGASSLPMVLIFFISQAVIAITISGFIFVRTNLVQKCKMFTYSPPHSHALTNATRRQEYFR